MKEKIREERDRMEREAKLFATLWTRAAGRRLELNIAAVPIDDPSRVLPVSQEEFEEAEELGFRKIYGLRLVVGLKIESRGLTASQTSQEYREEPHFLR